MKPDIYDSIYMDVVRLVEDDNIQGEQYIETANKLKNKYVITLIETPPVEDGKLGGEVKTAEEIFEYMYQSFKGTRYSCEWWDDFKDLNSDIKECIIAAMDEYKSQPSTPVQDGWVDLVLACNRMIKAFDDAPVEWQQTQDVMDAEIAIRTALLTLPSPPVNKQD